MRRQMTIVSLLLGVAAPILLTAILPSRVDAKRPVALLLSCDGDVVVHSGNETIDGSFGVLLDEGDEVITGSSAKAVVIWASGLLAPLDSGKTMRIDGQSGGQAAGTNIGGKGFRKIQYFARLQNADMADETEDPAPNENTVIQIVAPTLTVIRDGQPTFRWAGAPEDVEVQLTLLGRTGILWQQDVTGMSSIEYPSDAPPLEPGVSYSWTLDTSDPPQSAKAFFDVIQVQQAEELDGELGKISIDNAPNETAYYLVRASLFYDYGLTYDALVATREAASIDDDDPTLRLILARLYAEVGISEEALGEYESISQPR